MSETATLTSREETIAAADEMLKAAGLPTYSQLPATVESYVTEECTG